MKTSKFRPYLLAAASGLLLAAAFPPLPFFLMAFVAFAPLFMIFADEANNNRKHLLLYIAFFCYHFGSNWWIMSWQSETDPYLMMAGFFLALGHPFFFFIPFWGFFYLRRKLGFDKALWFFPVLWTTFEWLHSLGEASYPWLTVGNTQIMNIYWIQFIDITGIWGASFLLVLINVLFYKIVMGFAKLDKPERSFGKFIRIKTNKLKFVLLLLAIFVPLIYSAMVIRSYDYDEMIFNEKTINIGLIQPNINPWQKWEGGVLDQIAMHIELQDSLTNKVGELDLGIWSETAIPYHSLDLNAFHLYPFLQQWVDTSKTSLLSGFTEIYFFKGDETPSPTAREYGPGSDRIYEPYNSMLLLNPNPYAQENPQIYRKMRLTPFAERLPYAEVLTFAQSWFEWGVGISSWGRGTEQNNLLVRKGRDSVWIGTIVCIESIYPGFVRNFARNGAGVLVVVTNDAWYDYTVGPMQHYLLSAARAIESRRFVARAANTGVTGFISPIGRSVYQAPQYERIAIAASIPILDNKTIYVRLGDWFPWILTIGSVVIIIYARVRKAN
jgi:apolipoprotein N-acyltransferase